MLFHRIVLRTANAIFNLIVICLLLVGGAYSAFALWDNERVYSAAGDVQADMIKIKPEIVLSEDTEEEGADFSELLAINEDVCAWVTMDGTNIDLPVVQGETNLTYINTDVYGQFSLPGSIFLDSRNKRDFSETYNLLYGHNMADHQMFGDLQLYKDKKFFDENTTGILITPDKAFQLEIIACMLVESNDHYIFEPTNWKHYNTKNLYKYIEENSMYFHGDKLEELKEMNQREVQILTLSTCSNEYTDARTIVLTHMIPYGAGELGGQEE